MSRDLTRAALALLCVAVVLFGGSLFPTAGFGSYPAGVGDGGAAEPNGLPTPTAGTDLTPTPATATTTAGRTDAERTATATATATQTETETPAAGTPEVGGPLTDAFLTLVVVLGAVGTGLLALTFAPRIDEGTAIAGLPVGRFQTNLRAFFGAVPRRTTAFVVGFSASVPGVLDRTFGVVADASAAFGVVFGSLARGTGKTLAALGSGLGAAAFALPSAVSGLSSLLGGFRRLGSGSVSRRRRRRRRRRDSDDADSASPTSEPGTEPDPVPRTVEEAWAAMAERVPVGNRRTATPEEYARAAVAAGFPESAVRRLTDAFERVRYGGQSSGEQLPTARDALARIRAFWNGGEEA